MNKVCFTAMQAQLRPSPAAEEALRRRLAQPVPRRRPQRSHAALAACVALLLCAAPAYRALTPPPQHSYTLLAPGEPSASTAGDSTFAEENTPATPEDTPADTPSVPAPAPGPDRRPYEGAGAAACQTLLAAFGNRYPDWYGGAYLNQEGRLVVLAVLDTTPGLPEALQGSEAVVLEARAKYAYTHLRDLQEQVVEAMIPLGIFNGCGIDEENNRLSLTLREASQEALTLLAELDPADDAIYVEVIPWSVDLCDDCPGDKSISQRHDIEAPEPTFAGPDAPVPDEDDAIAYEPFDPN